jgi:hypothetical protein
MNSGYELLQQQQVLRRVIKVNGFLNQMKRSITMNLGFRLGKVVSVISLAALLSVPASAQYNGGGGGTSTGGGYTPPKGGYSSSTGIAIGAAAAAGIGLAYLVLHKTSMVGCVSQSADGLTITNDKNNVSYALETGSQDLVAGHRVEVKGKKFKAEGKQAFRVTSAKDLGACSVDHASSSSVPTL